MLLCDLAQSSEDARRVLLVRFTVPRASVDLRLRQALPGADVDLSQPGLLLDRKVEPPAASVEPAKSEKKIVTPSPAHPPVKAKPTHRTRPATKSGVPREPDLDAPFPH